MATILGERNFFLKIGMATLQSYPVGQQEESARERALCQLTECF